MRKWLAALFVLLMIPAAGAENADVTPEWLQGVWRFAGGSEVCGYGFRLQADGALTYYMTDDYEAFPPSRLIPLANEAAWRYQGGKLVITSGGKASRYPVEAVPERSRENGADVIHLAEGTGGGFYQRGDASHVVDLSSPIPQDTLYAIEAAHPDFRLEGYHELMDSPMGDLAFALIRCEHGRRLYGYRLTRGKWVQFLDTVKAVPQNDALNLSMGLSRDGGAYSNLWYDPDRYDFTYPAGAHLGIYTDNGESYEQCVDYVIQADGIRLVGYMDSPGCMIDLADGRLVFYNIGNDDVDWAACTFDTRIEAVDFYALPRNVAQAQTASVDTEAELFTEAAGFWVWRTDSPKTALGDGVYLHVDGTCALYDVSAYDEYDPDLITGLTFREGGRWSVQGDTLLVAVGDTVHTLPAQYMVWPAWEWHDGLRIADGAYRQTTPGGMKIPVESVMPEDVLEYIRAFHPKAVIEDYAELPNTPGGPMALVLHRDASRRQLNIFQWADGKWNDVEDVVKGVPQIDLPDVWLSASKGGGTYSELWYDEALYDAAYPDGPGFGVWTSNGETYEEGVEYVWEDGGFKLIYYGDNPVRMIDVVGDLLVFYNISDPGITSVPYSFNRELDAVDFYALPRRETDVRFWGEAEPALPTGHIRKPFDPGENYLAQQDVKLRANQKYPVYMGPGKQYGRAANGKAVVSTKGWVQVLGEYDGWLLIHYAISDKQYRFGWITVGALAKGETAEALPFVFGDYMVANPEVALTDDPLNSRTVLCMLPNGITVERLARLGDAYSLVRVTVDGKVRWGFVPSWVLGHG